MKTKPNSSINALITGSANAVFTREDGLTKREYMATMIYSGMSSIPDNLGNRKLSAGLAVECADYLIEALNKDKNEQK